MSVYAHIGGEETCVDVIDVNTLGPQEVAILKKTVGFPYTSSGVRLSKIIKELDRLKAEAES